MEDRWSALRFLTARQPCASALPFQQHPIGEIAGDAYALWKCKNILAAKAANGLALIARWQGREGGQERANYGLLLSELCDVLGVPRPDPAAATTEENDYVFERGVKDHNPDGTASSRRIDLYKRGCFVLEAKQSR